MKGASAWQPPPSQPPMDPQPTSNNPAFWSGLTVSVLVAATAHLSANETLTWRDWVEMASVVAIAVNAYLIRR